jgi:hypothetical protein
VVMCLRRRRRRRSGSGISHQDLNRTLKAKAALDARRGLWRAPEMCPETLEFLASNMRARDG